MTRSLAYFTPRLSLFSSAARVPNDQCPLRLGRPSTLCQSSSAASPEVQRGPAGGELPGVRHTWRRTCRGVQHVCVLCMCVCIHVCTHTSELLGVFSWPPTATFPFPGVVPRLGDVRQPAFQGCRNRGVSVAELVLAGSTAPAISGARGILIHRMPCYLFTRHLFLEVKLSHFSHESSSKVFQSRVPSSSLLSLSTFQRSNQQASSCPRPPPPHSGEVIGRSSPFTPHHHPQAMRNPLSSFPPSAPIAVLFKGGHCHALMLPQMYLSP